MTKGNWVTMGAVALGYLVAGLIAFSTVTAKVDRFEKDVGDLDSYDAHLSEEIDEVSDRLIRQESEMSAVKSNQQELKYTMNEILKEMKQMNENIIRIGVSNASTHNKGS